MDDIKASELVINTWARVSHGYDENALACFYQNFADPTRLRILIALSDTEMCVNDLANTLSMTVSAVSHQLRILRDAQLLKTRRDGKAIYYTVSDRHVARVITSGAEHLKECKK